MVPGSNEQKTEHRFPTGTIEYYLTLVEEPYDTNQRKKFVVKGSYLLKAGIYCFIRAIWYGLSCRQGEGLRVFSSAAARRQAGRRQLSAAIDQLPGRHYHNLSGPRSALIGWRRRRARPIGLACLQV